MNKTGIKPDNRGFTLVEILIAILIFSIVISTLFSSFRAFIVSSEKVKTDLIRNEKINDLLNRIQWDLSSIFLVQKPRYKKKQFDSDPDPFGFKGTNKTLGQKTVSSLVFSSLAHAALGNALRPGVARIGYYLKENKKGLFDLFRSDVLYPFPDEIESCQDPILCRDISRFEAVYTDDKGDEHPYWDSDAKEFSYTLPWGIYLKIGMGPEGEERVFQTFIRLNSGRPPIE